MQKLCHRVLPYPSFPLPSPGFPHPRIPSSDWQLLLRQRLSHFAVPALPRKELGLSAGGIRTEKLSLKQKCSTEAERAAALRTNLLPQSGLRPFEQVCCLSAGSPHHLESPLHSPHPTAPQAVSSAQRRACGLSVPFTNSTSWTRAAVPGFGTG